METWWEFKIPRMFVWLVVKFKESNKLELGLVIAIVLCLLGIIIPIAHELGAF